MNSLGAAYSARISEIQAAQAQIQNQASTVKNNMAEYIQSIMSGELGQVADLSAISGTVPEVQGLVAPQQVGLVEEDKKEQGTLSNLQFGN